MITRAANTGAQGAVPAPPVADCKTRLDANQVQACLRARRDSIIVYNQHAGATTACRAEGPDEAALYRGSADSRGVPGPQAQRRREPDDATLQLIYQQR